MKIQITNNNNKNKNNKNTNTNNNNKKKQKTTKILQVSHLLTVFSSSVNFYIYIAKVRSDLLKNDIRFYNSILHLHLISYIYIAKVSNIDFVIFYLICIVLAIICIVLTIICIVLTIIFIILTYCTKFTFYILYFTFTLQM